MPVTTPAIHGLLTDLFFCEHWAHAQVHFFHHDMHTFSTIHHGIISCSRHVILLPLFSRVTRAMGQGKVPPSPSKPASMQPDTHRAGWTWTVAHFSDRASEHLQKLSKCPSPYLSMPTSFQFFGENPKMVDQVPGQLLLGGVLLGKGRHLIAHCHREPEAVVLFLASIANVYIY